MAAKVITRIIETRGALVAGVTALWVAVAILATRIAGELVLWFGALPYLSAGAPAYPFGQSLLYSLLIAIPFAVGYFMSLWFIAPIAEELRIGHVVTRAVLATGVGSTLVFVVSAILAIVGAVSPGGGLFGSYFPVPGFDSGLALGGLSNALSSGLLTLVQQLPLGVLGGVLLWTWRKGNPPEHQISGLIDL